MEVQVIAPMWHKGKQIEIVEGKPLPVIDLPDSEAVYLANIGRVRFIEQEEATEIVAESSKEKSPRKKTKEAPAAVELAAQPEVQSAGDQAAQVDGGQAE